ncbi:uncharacterized protein LOC100822410 isoform X2 [Brachypodium distachyon]|uniref:Uncharacterized protein n=1 Tax=Brachypodium distachyon TaxID=15368 RepID=A0A0Q3KN98_BRADI|nr:uncharacterized protein LOC100822410 isoform X2 [Brachypodium distachyon]PNT68526.1 hypothetical protein BRADI_3g41869v3 [Brachypodium distachyon]|eukprot:XP_014751710.1 uncharacterized protein LOC100822410 isoform X2 [Brachypodium distachyon]
MLIGTAHGERLANIIKNPVLSDLIGGVKTVTLGDEEARARHTLRSILERKAPPAFPFLVELRELTLLGDSSGMNIYVKWSMWTSIKYVSFQLCVNMVKAMRSGSCETVLPELLREVQLILGKITPKLPSRTVPLRLYPLLFPPSEPPPTPSLLFSRAQPPAVLLPQIRAAMQDATDGDPPPVKIPSRTISPADLLRPSPTNSGLLISLSCSSLHFLCRVACCCEVLQPSPNCSAAG